MDKVILSSQDAAGYVECSRRHIKTTGKLVKKGIFKFGPFRNPNNRDEMINVDQNFYNALKDNFDKGRCPIVQFPMVDASNRHVENPDSNLGEVVDISADDENIYAYIDVRRHAEDIGETILGASAKVNLNYFDRESGEHVGPTLIHVAATNNPFLTNLSDYEMVSLSDSDTNGEDIVLLTDSGADELPEKEKPMTKDELIATLLAEHGVDVNAGQAALAQVEGFVALSDVIGADEVSPTVVSSTIVELTHSIEERDNTIKEREEVIAALEGENQTLRLSSATEEVDRLIEAGRIRPATRDDMIDLSLTNRERFENFLLPEEDAQVELSEQGYSPTTPPLEESPEDRAKAEAQRLVSRVQ